MKLRSPAKINLFLRVLSKRPDGYHEIETLFERISLCDELTFQRARTGIRIETNSNKLPRGRRNLVYQAAKLLQVRTGVKKGVVIRIKKNIPIASGLGGGSSNAATTLTALNSLWRLGFSRSELLRLGGQLGSDVPFFILDTALALGRGRGEVLKEIKAPRKKIWHCLVKPPFGVSTRKAYEALKPTSLTPKKADVKMLLHSIQELRPVRLVKFLTNSLELSVGKRLTEILKIKKGLIDRGALGCLMSGSGPTVFGIFRNRNMAESAARFLRRNKRWWVHVASTL